MAKAKGKRTLQAQHIERVDLKYIGAAIDRSVEHLRTIKANAVDPAKVQKTINGLTGIRIKVRDECPQFWFCPFDVKRH